jgi:putative membrane protein
LRLAAYIGGLLGLALLVALFVREDFAGVLHSLAAGGLNLLWLVPYRCLYFLAYALGWLALLRPVDPAHRATLGYVFWVTSVRDAVDRLLPVASVGGSVVGIRLMRWRSLEGPQVAASVIVEILLTLLVLYLFVALGLTLLLELHGAVAGYGRFLLAFAASLPVPVAALLLLRHGSLAERVYRLLRPVLGKVATAAEAAALDSEVRASLRRPRPFIFAGALQFFAFVSGAFEVWFALRLFGHPVGAGTAVALESMMQAVRHLAFIVPSGLGVQEAGLVVFGGALGVDGELAIALSMAKRMRELLCGLPSLLSWQWLEARRLQPMLRTPS